MLASTDADGVVRLWDVRMVAEIAAIASGPHPCNAAAFDASGSSLAVGSDDGIVRFVSTQTQRASTAWPSRSGRPNVSRAQTP